MVLSKEEKRKRGLEAQRKWRGKNPDYPRDYRKKNREKIRKHGRDYYYRHHEDRKMKNKILQQKRRQKLRLEILIHYGGNPPKCACCNEENIGFLSIDHVNNDGAEHRKRIGASRLYYWLKKNNFPKGFQVLCFNCNLGRARNNGICPHGQGKT